MQIVKGCATNYKFVIPMWAQLYSHPDPMYFKMGFWRTLTAQATCPGRDIKTRKVLKV